MINSKIKRRDFVATLLAGSVTSLITGSIADAFGETRSHEQTFQYGPRAELKAQRLSWPGVKLELPSITLFSDPLINHQVWDDALKQPLAPLESARQQRQVLVTHLHPDHFDPSAVKKVLNGSGYLVCHIDSAAIAASQGFRVWAARLYEPMIFDDFTVVAVPAVDGYNSNQVSWVVTGGGKRIIHYGVSGTEGYAEYPNAEAAFVEFAKKRKLPIEILKPGEWMKWKANTS